MAYTIKSQPTTPNCTYTDLVYNVSSSNATNPQFNYLMDVYISGSATRLARVRQFPNPSLEAVFDPSRIFNDNLTYPIEFISNQSLSPGSGNYQKFNVEFGEEYGTSPSSSITTYANQANNIITVFPCQIDPNNGTGYNFLDSGSAVILSDAKTVLEPILMYNEARSRICVYNGTSTDISIKYDYSNHGTYYQTVVAGDIVNNGGPLIPTGGDLTISLVSGSSFIPVGTDSITYEFFTYCNYPVYTFQFINKYGFWDTFTTDKPARVTTSVDRQNYEQTFVDYSSTGAYDVARRGESNFSTSTEDNYTISSDWLSKEQADWLKQLIESDEVYLNVDPEQGSAGSDEEKFVPIVITNASYVQNTGRKDQKTFMYDITFRYANQRVGR